MWLFYNRFTLSRKINDPSNQDIVDELGEMCYQWAITRNCFPKLSKFDKWKVGLQGTWPSLLSMPQLTIQDSSIESSLDWIDLPDYLCEFRDWRLTLKQEGHGSDNESIFIHHIHLKRIDEVVEFSILQEMPTDEDNREWEELNIFPPTFIDEIISRYICEIKAYRIKNILNMTNLSNKKILEDNIIDKKRRLPLVLIPRYFNHKLLSDYELSDFCSKISSFAEVWIYDEDDYESYLNSLNISHNYAVIFNTEIEKTHLYRKSKSNKISVIQHSDIFDNTAQIIINEVLRPTRFMPMKSILSKNLQNALADNNRRAHEKKNMEKLEKIIHKSNSEIEKNNELIYEMRLLNNELMDSNSDLSTMSRINEKLEQRINGLELKNHKYKLKYDKIRDFKVYQDNLENQLREKNISFEEFKEKINLILDDSSDEDNEEEIEFVSLTDVIKKSMAKFPKIIFSSKVLQSSKNADNSGRYDLDDHIKVYEVFKILNNHFFTSKDGSKSNKSTNLHQELENLFPGKFSDESSATLSRIKNYSGNDRRIFPVILPQKGEFGIEMTWHIKPTSTIRINILALNHLKWDLHLWTNPLGKWYRDFKNEKGTPFGKNPHDFPKIIIGYCGSHLKTFSDE